MEDDKKTLAFLEVRLSAEENVEKLANISVGETTEAAFFTTKQNQQAAIKKRH